MYDEFLSLVALFADDVDWAQKVWMARDDDSVLIETLAEKKVSPSQDLVDALKDDGVWHGLWRLAQAFGLAPDDPQMAPIQLPDIGEIFIN